MRGVLYQELPRIESTRLEGWERWLVPALIVAATLTFAVILLLLRQPLFAGAALFAGLAGALFAHLKTPATTQASEPLVMGPDFSLVGSALALSREPTALTSSEGSLLIVNPAYRERFGGSQPPLELGADEQARQ